MKLFTQVNMLRKYYLMFSKQFVPKVCIFEVKHFYFTFLRFFLFSLAEKQYKELISSLREFAIRRTLLSVANTVQEGKDANVSLQGLIQAKNHSGYRFWLREFLRPNSIFFYLLCIDRNSRK